MNIAIVVVCIYLVALFASHVWSWCIAFKRCTSKLQALAIVTMAWSGILLGIIIAVLVLKLWN